MIRRMARDFTEKEVAPIAAEMDEGGEMPFAKIKRMAELHRQTERYLVNL